MKQPTYIIIILIHIVMLGCSSDKKVDTWSDQEIEEWFYNSSWNKDLIFQPDKSINLRTFVTQNLKNEKSWKAAFNFLKMTDFTLIPVGKYDLLDDGTFATVTDYLTKDHDTANYEFHEKYIDIQYVAKGLECMDILSSADIVDEIVAYNQSTDIAFCRGNEGKRLYADSSRFFCFFPKELHKPCLKVHENIMVRKIVVKIPYIE